VTPIAEPSNGFLTSSVCLVRSLATNTANSWGTGQYINGVVVIMVGDSEESLSND
jgi:hypothetical protein